MLAILLLLMVGLLGAELLVRLLLPYNTPETMRTYSLGYERAPFARSRLAPVGRLVEVDAGKAWGTKPATAPSDRLFYINALGFRGPSFAVRKPPGTIRVFVVGGSAVFDQNVSDDSVGAGNSWPNRAQSILQSRGYRIEVINAGVPGHSSIDALGRLASELWFYEPDVVVLYHGWNDIKNFHGAGISPERPLARVIQPLEAASDPYRRYWGAWDRILCHSQLYMKFRNLYLGRVLAVGEEGLLPTGASASSYGPHGPRQFEINVRAFVDMARTIGASPVLVSEATLVLNPNPGLDANIGFAYQLLDRPGLVRAYQEVYRITRAVAEESQVPFLDAGAELNGNADYFGDHVHLSPSGSAALAQLLADFLAAFLGDSAATGH